MSQIPKTPPRGRVLRQPRSLSHKNRRVPTVEQLAADQGVQPVADPQMLRGNFWSVDEGADEFLNWLRDVRREPGKDG